MSHPKLNQLTRAEELFDDGDLEKALEILNDRSHFEGLNAHQKIYYQYLKGLILLYQHKTEEAIKFGKQLFKEGQNLNDNLQSFDGLFFIIDGSCLANKFDDAFKKIGEAEELLKNISSEPKNELILREIRLDLLKAWINMSFGNIEVAEKCFEEILGKKKELGNAFEIVWAYSLMIQNMLLVKGRPDLAMKYNKKLLLRAKEIKFNHYWIANYHGYKGVIYQAIGELDKSLKHYLTCKKLIKELQSDFLNAPLFNNIGNVYCEKGEYDLALKYLEESLLFHEAQYKTPHPGYLCSIISIALKKGDIDYAQKYFQRLENIYNQTPDSHIELLYQYYKALILKNSYRIRDKAKAEKLLKQVIKKRGFEFLQLSDAYIHLCDLLLAEYRTYNYDEVLEELNQNIAQLLTIAENSHSYRIFCETFVLKAKLALLTFDMKAARRYLTQAQKIAQSYGLKRLAMKISIEHDNLLKELDKWEILNESKASLAERIELARLDDQMTMMLKKQSLEIPKISKENPVMIFILTEGGNLLFSKKFVDNFSFEDDILGGFLTTVNYIISEVFSEGLDRAVFGQYTLLMMPLQPFLVCYIFKGDSYFAYYKINNFLDSIKNDNLIWQSLQNFYRKNKLVELHSIPKLDSLITELFVEEKK
ncbi:MAG: tetratricopeptide repeat protein [Candidatus Odinarchaeota archaeon]